MFMYERVIDTDSESTQLDMGRHVCGTLWDAYTDHYTPPTRRDRMRRRVSVLRCFHSAALRHD